MSVDKLVDSTQLDADLTSVANAIRTKGGTSASLAFPAGFVSAIGDIPTGGGGTVESGSFVATSTGDCTLSVTSLHSFVAVWLAGWTIEDDLSSNPYGAYKKLSIFAISPDNSDLPALAGLIAGGFVNYAGTAYNGYSERYSGNYNNVEFTSSYIKLGGMRVGGVNRTFVDGATYNWRAW